MTKTVNGHQASLVSTVDTMADTYMANIDVEYGNEYLTEDGMEILGKLFESIAPEFRSTAFEMFLHELDIRGVKVDPKEFLGTE